MWHHPLIYIELVVGPGEAAWSSGAEGPGPAPGLLGEAAWVPGAEGPGLAGGLWKNSLLPLLGGFI